MVPTLSCFSIRGWGGTLAFLLLIKHLFYARPHSGHFICSISFDLHDPVLGGGLVDQTLSLPAYSAILIPTDHTDRGPARTAAVQPVHRWAGRIPSLGRGRG